MPINYSSQGSCSYYNNNNSCCCEHKDGCGCNSCPDFSIRRHDTKPPFKVQVNDCDGPINLEGLIAEVNMWALGRLKLGIGTSDTYFQLAGDIGFEQTLVGDIIVMERARQPEQMLITGFDEDLKYIQVQRGYNGTPISNWKKGSKLKIFRVLNAPAQTEMFYRDRQEIDGIWHRNELHESYLSYNWQPEDTCLPGCFQLEFKLLKMKSVTFFTPGGHWTGAVNRNASGDYYTGSQYTDSSVKLTYKSDDSFRIVAEHWQGERHWGEDGYWYTGRDKDCEDRRRIHFCGPAGAAYVPASRFFSDYPAQWDSDNQYSPEWDSNYKYPPGWGKALCRGVTAVGGEIALELVHPKYLIPTNQNWTGEFHQWSDGNYYTGTNHDDGSLYLETNGLAVPNDIAYNSPSQIVTTLNYIEPSVISFPSVQPTPSQIGCTLGEGVEWVRRFPLEQAAFVIRIIDSPTAEL